MSNSLENTAIKNSDKIVIGEDGIPVYKSLYVIPENLKSNSYFKENGLKHDGIVLGRVKCGYFDYPVYDVNTAVKTDDPVKPKKTYKKKKNKSKKIQPDYTKWDDVPKNLFTSSQLKKKGLRHNNEIEGVALINKKVYYLFDINKAIDFDELPKGAKSYKTKSKAPNNLEGVSYFSNRGILHNGIVKGLYKSSSGYHELYDKNDFIIEDKIRYKNFCADDKNSKNKVSCSWDEIMNDININPDKYVVLDTETTGKNAYDEIIQLSIIDLEGNILFNSYFNPKVKVSKGATEIHGMKTEDLKDAPKWSTKWREISSILKDKTIIAYNAVFDIGMIKSTCSNHYIQIDFEINSACALTYARRNYRYLSSHKLINVVSYLKMDFNENNAHEALFDTYACLYVIKQDATIFKKRALAKKYFNALVKYDVHNVGAKQRKIEGNNWLKKNFNCRIESLNNTSIEVCNSIINKLEKFVLDNNLL